MGFPKGRIPDDNPVYYFASFLGLRYVGSGSESSDDPAAGGRTSSADCNPGRCCTDGCSGPAQRDSDTDHDRTSDADHDEGSGAGRANYTTAADSGQSWTTRYTGNAGEFRRHDVRARASRHNAEPIECKCRFVDR
jgi:hypothetical protein